MTQKDTQSVRSVAESYGTSPPGEVEFAPPRAAEFVICDHTIEPMFRDEKQLLDLAVCQSPRVEAQETHIALVLVAWVVLQRLRQAPSQTTGEVRAELIATIWGHETRFSPPVSDSASTASVMQGVQMP